MTWWSYGKGVHRRDAIRTLGAAGAGSFAPAGGQVSQRPDQGSNPPASVVAPTQSAGTLRARTVIVSGPGGQLTGVFVYLPSVGAGNLIDSVTNGSGTDTAGNTYLPNITSYSQGTPSLAANLGAGALQWYTAPSPHGSWTPGAFIGSGQTNILGFGAGTVGGAGAFMVGPSGDTSGVTDSATFASIDAQIAYLILPGTYYIDSPIVMPAGSSLIGLQAASGNPVANFGAGSLPLKQVVIRATSGFTGAGLVTMTSAGSQNGGQYLAGIALDGSQISGANTIDGINITGAVAQVTIRDMVVYGGASTELGGSGLHLVSNSDGNPDALKVFSSQFQKCGTHGVHQAAGVADSYWEAISCTANGSDAWLIVNGNSTRYVACKGETSTGYGFNLDGAAGFTGFVQFHGCSTAGNSTGGFNLAGTGTGTFYFNFCHTTEGTPWTYAGNNNVKTPAAYNTSTAAPTFN